MSLFVQETGLALCLWILASVTVAIALLLLSVVRNSEYIEYLSLLISLVRFTLEDGEFECEPNDWVVEFLNSNTYAFICMDFFQFDGKRDELRENILYPEGSFTAALADCLIAPQERLKKLESKITTKCAKLEISQEKIEETKRTISELEVTSEEVQVKYQELLRQLKSELSRTEAECQHLHDQIEKITTRRDKLKQELRDVGSSLKVSKADSASILEEELFLSETQMAKSYGFNMQESPNRLNPWSSSPTKYSSILAEN